MLIHIVKPQETIAMIAAQYGVSIERLLYDNQILDPTQLVVGQALLVLIPALIHTVQRGESLYTIAQQYNVSVINLIRNNPYIIDQNALYTGDIIVIQYDTKKRRSIATGGYVYQFVNPSILEQTLPYLTSLCIFSYGFTMEGYLLPINDEDIIQSSREFGVDPVLVLAPMGDDGNFNNALVTAIAQNTVVQDVLISNLIQTVQSRNYAGVNIDFEFIKGEDAIGFASFVNKLRIAMNELGYFVTIALAPKVSESQVGLLYEGMNYKLLGEASNEVLLMTYEWGYTYGPPLPVAPLNEVRKVVDFAVTQIPPSKINLGMANYGYDWTLPFIKGESKAQSIGLNEAIQIAIKNGASIEYDEVAQSPFFTYFANGSEHIVWFEDVRSILAKLNLMEEKNLLGVGYWQLMKLFRPNWLLINALYEIL